MDKISITLRYELGEHTGGSHKGLVRVLLEHDPEKKGGVSDLGWCFGCRVGSAVKAMLATGDFAVTEKEFWTGFAEAIQDDYDGVLASE